MFGAIIGDLAGSIYEFGQAKQVSEIKVNNLIEKDSFFSDDTILTMAILDAIVNKREYSETLKEYGNNFMESVPKHIPYFKKMFSPGFEKWINGIEIGTSTGNGAMMRISPIGYMFNTEKEVIENVIKATSPSHNTQEAIECATIVALIIFYARKNMSKNEIVSKLNLKFSYIPFTKFNTTCYETLNNCLYALFTSNSFEESLEKVISFGGDTDTNACIVGSMAEAMFQIPEKYIQDAKEKLPQEFITLLDNAYKKI